MTTATVSTVASGAHGVDRLALRIGTALVVWAGRRAERSALAPEQRTHRIALERIELHRDTAAQRATLLR
jgi:hypothetical protein